MDLQADLQKACELLSASKCRHAEAAYSLLKRHINVPVPQTIGAEIPDEIDPYMAEATAVWDEIIEIRFLSEKMQDIIEGRDDGPMLTPVKPKRKKVKTEIIEEEEENSYLPKPTPNTVTDEQIQNHRASLITSFSEQKYADLRSKCKQQNLNTKGKKTELVDRLTEKTLCTEYGSPRMRNSYQTAMNSPLPVAKKDPQPRSLQSQTSTSSLRSTTSSIKSTSSMKKTIKPRLRSPSPSGQPKSLPKTPSFKSRIKDTISSSGFASPRPWSKTPSKSRLLDQMTRTPSKADLEQKEAERERKIKERKAQKEQEAARRKAEKAAHAEEIRNKKNALDAEKKRGMEKVFSLTKSDKTKKTGLKEKALLKKKAEQKRLEEQKRKQEEELRIQEAKRKEEMARWKMEEEQRRAAEEAKAAELAAQATPQKQHSPVDCYEMTPQGSDKWAANPSTAENYNIDDLESGDETDDESAPRKAIPLWANMRSTQFRSAITRQYHDNGAKYEQIFDSINPNRPVDLTELFDSLASIHAQKRYRKPRNSSGQWVPMVQPRALIDRTLNLDQSVYPIN